MPKLAKTSGHPEQIPSSLYPRRKCTAVIVQNMTIAEVSAHVPEAGCNHVTGASLMWSSLLVLQGHVSAELTAA